MSSRRTVADSDAVPTEPRGRTSNRAGGRGPGRGGRIYKKASNSSWQSMLDKDQRLGTEREKVTHASTKHKKFLGVSRGKGRPEGFHRVNPRR